MRHPAQGLYEKRWGVFNHYLYGRPGNDMDEGDETDWNARVDSFDVQALARTLGGMGAGYYFITLMQGRKYMLSPNDTFDKIAGTRPGEACARRDLVADLYEALSAYGIDLYLYYTGDGPYKDVEIGRRFGFSHPRGQVNGAFVGRWAAVLEEYARRYGDRVKGWWIDGCYSHFGYGEALMRPYHEAVKRGNHGAIAAFNGGLKPALVKWYPGEEFVCGEFEDFTCIPSGRFVDGAQAHILAPLGISPSGAIGDSWRRGGARHDRAFMKRYIDRVHRAGGVVTVDIMVEDDGSLDREQVDALWGI